jgi:phenylacetate-CoA ligase
MINIITALKAYTLLKNQWKNPEEIKQIQNEKLRRLIKHAYEKVPYYRGLFDSAKLKPADVQSTDDLIKVPFTTREILSKLPLKKRVAKDIDIKKCRIDTTSGTTSVPFPIYRTHRETLLDGIAEIRTFSAFGAKPWHKMAQLSGDKNIPAKRSIFEHHSIWRSWKISTWEPVEYWIEKIQRWKPQIIWGYVTTLKVLAEGIIKKGIKNINPSLVISSGGVLFQETRNVISSAFNTRVFDFYASWEAGTIAWECPICNGYHVNSDMVFLEVLKNGKPAPPGHEGEVVITNLNNYAMPFIRYRQLDGAIRSNEEPLCGRTFSLLKTINGRLGDYIILPSGKKVTPHLFARVMSLTPGLAQFKFVQEKIDLITIEIVPLKVCNQVPSKTLEKELRKLVGHDMKIEISLVKEIKFDSWHKMRLISSKVLRKKEGIISTIKWKQ